VSRATTNTTTDDFVYIDLDEPTPWWTSVVGGVAIVLVILVLVAPWVINLDDRYPDSVANSTLQSTGSFCRPNASGLPNVFDPSLASWSRFCEWFIAPELNP
jgi:hypothetical protein